MKPGLEVLVKLGDDWFGFITFLSDLVNVQHSSFKVLCNSCQHIVCLTNSEGWL